jgi:hypothetical protein
MTMASRQPGCSRRRCLSLMASAAGVIASRSLCALAAAPPSGDPSPPDGNADIVGQGLAEQCGLRDAPWLNDRIAGEFERFRSGWGALRATYQALGDSRRTDLLRRQQQGFTCPKADQILAEARWLAAATTDQQQILARFSAFDEAFAQQKDMYGLPPVEQAEDGSWAPYVSEPFHKLDISIDYINRIVGAANPILKRCDGIGATPILERPLRFLAHWADPEAMVEDLRQSRISAIHRTGRWNRQKYSSLLSSLPQLILKTPIQRWLSDVAQDRTFTDRHKVKLLAFLDEAQDSCTGCWRDGYRFADGTTHQAYDLSNVYHVVQYRRDGIRHWDAIADGLIAVQGFQYPQGPRGPSGQTDDHNDYDVLRVALRCLNDARPPLAVVRQLRLHDYVHAVARGAVDRLNRDFPAAGGPANYDGSVESDCFRVQLLELVGFWSGESRYLAIDQMRERQRLATAMLERLTAYGDDSPMPVLAMALLRSHLKEC